MFMLVVNGDSKHIGEIALSTIKTAPPITITGMIIFGYTVQDWVCVLTGIWVLLQIYLALYNHFKDKSVCRICKKKH